jgi:hypothetical protein
MSEWHPVGISALVESSSSSATITASQQPLVILGGFLSSPVVYYGMRAALARIARAPVEIAGVHSVHWLASTVINKEAASHRARPPLRR